MREGQAFVNYAGRTLVGAQLAPVAEVAHSLGAVVLACKSGEPLRLHALANRLPALFC